MRDGFSLFAIVFLPFSKNQSMSVLFKLLFAQHEPQLFSRQDTLYGIPEMLRFRIGRTTLNNPLPSAPLQKLEKEKKRVSPVSIPRPKKNLQSHNLILV